jgi:ribosomal protein S12 methylthiotransferase
MRDYQTLNSLAAPKRSEGGSLSTLNYLTARSEADAPDIDGRVYVCGALPVGEFAKVKVIGHTDYDLIAESIL